MSNLNASQEYTILPKSQIRKNAIHLNAGYGCQDGLRSRIIPPAGTKMSLDKMENLVYRMCKSCADEGPSGKYWDNYMDSCLKDKNIMIEAMTGKNLDSNHRTAEPKINAINVAAVIAVPVESQADEDKPRDCTAEPKINVAAVLVVPVESQAHEPKSTFFQNGFARWKHDMGIEKNSTYTIEDLMRQNAQQGKE